MWLKEWRCDYFLFADLRCKKSELYYMLFLNMIFVEHMCLDTSDCFLYAGTKKPSRSVILIFLNSHLRMFPWLSICETIYFNVVRYYPSIWKIYHSVGDNRVLLFSFLICIQDSYSRSFSLSLCELTPSICWERTIWFAHVRHKKFYGTR